MKLLLEEQTSIKKYGHEIFLQGQMESINMILIKLINRGLTSMMEDLLLVQWRMYLTILQSTMAHLIEMC